MGIYEEKTFVKDKKGNLKLIDRKIVKAPHEVGRWERSAELEAKSGLSDATTLQVDVTKSGLNKKVTSIMSKLEGGEIIVRNLITTSNKLSNKAKLKYKGVKGCDKPIRR